MSKKMTVSEIMYYVYFGVMLGAKAIGLYEGQLLYNVCLILGAAFFVLKMIMTKYSILEYLVIMALLALGTVVYVNSGEKSLLIFLTMMIGIKAISIDRLFKLGTLIWGISFITIYVLSVIGLIPEVAYTMSRRNWPPVLRHALGYPHPNTLHIAYLVVTVFALYICRNMTKKYLTLVAVLLMLGNCYVFMYSLSRNGFVITSLHILIAVILTWKSQFTKLDKLIIRMVYPISALAMILLPLVLKGRAFDFLNTLLAGRLEYSKYYLTYQPLELFGLREIPVLPENMVIDSSYVYLLFRLGIVAFVLYSIAMISLIEWLIRKNLKAELTIVLSLTVGGVIETFLFNQSFKNFIFVFLGCYFYELLSCVNKKLPVLIGKERFGCSVGQLNIMLPETKKFGKRVPVNVLAFTAMVFIIVGIATSTVYFAFFPAPSDIFLPAEEVFAGDSDEVYLTIEQVEQLRRSGNIVRGYTNELTPLYRMHRKAVVKVEYVRNIFSYGLWGGSLAAIVLLAFFISKSKVRLFLKNKTIDNSYKENVLIVHNYYRIPGGEDIVVANEKALLEAHGHKVVLYSRNNADAGDHNFIQKIGLAFSSLFSIKTYRDICEIIDKEKIDVIHVHNTVALVSPAVYLAGINRYIPVVQTIHNFRLVCPNGVLYIKNHICERCIEHGLKASLLFNCYRNSKLQTFVCALSMKIQRVLLTYRSIYYICLTSFNKEKLLALKQIKEENIYIKPNFTPENVEIIPFEQRKRQIVYAGRIEKIKGLDLLLQAWMKMGDKAPKLLICGQGEIEEWCKEYIKNNEMANVEMLGYLPNREVKRIVAESMAVIYPTQWYEGFPMAVAEAYTAGTPIIASDIGNVGSLVDEGISGVKFKHNSVVDIAKKVEEFMETPIKLPVEYTKKYTAENNYYQLKHIYEDVRRKEIYN